LCSMFLRTKDIGEDTSKQQGFYAFIERLYGRTLHWSIVHRPVMLAIAALVTLSAVLLYPRIGQELVPDDDQSEFNIGINLPNGTSYERTTDFLKDTEGMIRKMPEVQTVFSEIRNGNANYYVGMTPLESRTLSQQELMRQARAALIRRYPGARIQVTGGTD